MVTANGELGPDQGDGGAPPADPWVDRVAVARSAGRSFAYRPGRMLCARGPWNRLPGSTRTDLLQLIGGDSPAVEGDSDVRGPLVLTGVADPVSAARHVRDEGVEAQVDHVFFATQVESAGVHGSPVMFGGVGGLGGACGWCRVDMGPPSGTATAPRKSTVRSSAAPKTMPTKAGGTGACRVVVVDTGLAADPFLPAGLQAQSAGRGIRDEPDADDDGNLDPAAGHATFIAALVEQLAPDAKVEVRQVLSTFGDGSDSDVADTLWTLVDAPPDVVNLSFAGYSEGDVAPLAIRNAVAELVARGTAVVAAAGNDATCRPAWPASLDGVVGVGALGPAGPAWFTNHGPWVRACAPGVDVVSRFFEVPLSPAASQQHDVRALTEVSRWAAWSGTSFAAPIVAGVLARAVLAGATPEQAVGRLIDDPDLVRLAGLGTIINERPW